jgi:uncharacterized protein DUF998
MAATTTALARPAGLLSRVTPNSRTHWVLLTVGAAGSVIFGLTYLTEGLLRPGYDSVTQPMSALSLGPGGWLQITNFVVFGLTGIVTAPAWRATLTPGLGATWYPRLRVLIGLAMISAGLFTQDPGLGYPVGVTAPAHPSSHATVHNLGAYVSLTLTVAELSILSVRFAREPRWRAWSPLMVSGAVVMMALLATFGVLISHGGPGGVFEKAASTVPTLLGLAIFVRLAVRRDARVRS